MSEEKTGNGHHVELDRLLQDIKIVLRDGQELLKAGLGTVRQHARLKAESTGRFVREKPYQSLGVVFGLGILAGFLIAGAIKGSHAEEEEA